MELKIKAYLGEHFQCLHLKMHYQFKREIRSFVLK